MGEENNQDVAEHYRLHNNNITPLNSQQGETLAGELQMQAWTVGQC